MTKEDNQSESQEQQPGRRFSQEQYDLLVRCSEKRDMTEWIIWRNKHPNEEIILAEAHLENTYLERTNLKDANIESAFFSGAHLEKASLDRANLEKANLEEAHLENAYLAHTNMKDANITRAHLEGAKLEGADLENANLEGANLEKAILAHACMEDANFTHTHLEGANLEWANFEGANLESANLTGANLAWANLRRAHLENANLRGTDLEMADLRGTHLENANLYGANLKNAKLWGAYLMDAILADTNLQGTELSRNIVDSRTLVWKCKVDRNTKCEAVGLGNIQIDPATKQLLEYNIRRGNWEEWYEKHPKLKWTVKPFWWISDYGLRTWRIILCFFGLAFVFAFAYFLWPNCVMVNGSVGEIRGFVHALYFSVVTMTTLGFGDIAANPDSWQGQVLLMVQVILGYVLLGALVTRFAVLFTAGGPAGKFTKEIKS